MVIVEFKVIVYVDRRVIISRTVVKVIVDKLVVGSYYFRDVGGIKVILYLSVFGFFVGD